ncbi:MAG: NrdH-redoxin [Marinilabiliales bacterium]|nr:MAG: NrdH-redoxin [Marinilabiliales bacterium]
MIKIHSLQELKTALSKEKDLYLLLYKSGSDASNCAYKNIEEAEKEVSNIKVYVTDVANVRDIHTEYDIKSAPSLLEFEEGNLKNVVKGCNDKNYIINLFENKAFKASGSDKKPVKRVTVYTTPTCSWCTTLKNYLNSHNIKYREVNVATNQLMAEEMVRKSGQQGVPQTEINGQMIIGFNRERINQLLEINE